MVEQRVISQKIGARPGAAPAAAPPEPAAEVSGKKSGKKRVLLIILAVVLVGAGAAAYLLLGRGGGDGGQATPEPEPTLVPGEVLSVEPVSINLADGHYLRLGLALQLTDTVEGEPDPSRALDLAIALYSGRSITEVSDPTGRDTLKAQLLAELTEAYEGEVMDLYLTDYVTQ